MSRMPEPRPLRKWGHVLFTCLAACGAPAVPADYEPAPKLVATDATFGEFRTWERIPLESPMVPLQAMPGPAFVYANVRPDPGVRRWPIGAVLVKTVEPSADFRDWTVHAMVKRSERFNPEGSVGWEFFGLQLDETGRPTILWRSDGHNDGHAYGSSTMALPPDRELSCNDCHALHWQSDAVLTPALSLAP
jgi:hypothetical protein